MSFHQRGVILLRAALCALSVSLSGTSPAQSQQTSKQGWRVASTLRQNRNHFQFQNQADFIRPREDGLGGNGGKDHWKDLGKLFSNLGSRSSPADSEPGAPAPGSLTGKRANARRHPRTREAAAGDCWHRRDPRPSRPPPPRSPSFPS